MIRSNALLAGLAGAFVFAAPAFAQDAASTAPAAAEQAAQPSSLTLTPGSSVKSKDGTELGKLVGVQAGTSGQELTVRGADGQLRPVAVTGIQASGSDIMLDATMADFQAATPIAEDAPAEAAVPADEAEAQPADPVEPMA